MIRLLYINPFDSATATAINTAGAAYPAANVQDRRLKQVWRSTGVSNQWLKFDLGSAKQVTLFTFFQNNLTSAATVKLYAHTSDLGNTEAAWASAAYVGTISTFDTRAGLLELNKTYRYWLLAFTDAANPSGYIECGRVFGGIYISPSENFNENFTESHNDPSDQFWSVGGTVYSTARERYKVFNFVFADIDQTDQQVLRDLFAAVYKTEPFVMAMDTSSEPTDLTRYGVLQSDLVLEWTTNNRANVSLSFRELR